MKSIRFIGFGLLAVFLFSCRKKTDTAPIDFQYDYFPINTGHYIEYKVLEIHHDTLAAVKHDTSRYQLRIVFGDTILDLENEIAQRYSRYVRNNSSQNWQFKDLWTTKISNNRAELVEENNRRIKLVFKPSLDKQWNSNAFNTDNPQTFSYSSIDNPLDFNGFYFDKTLTVLEADFTSLIDYQKAYSVYAKGVGLIKKYYKWLEINDFDSTKINSGTEIYYDMINYGQQ
jgi:hypothetical protein